MIKKLSSAAVVTGALRVNYTFMTLCNNKSDLWLEELW